MCRPRSVQRGVDFLTETQQPDGRWAEELTTGTGFPDVFYISYGFYKDYFPLLALATLRSDGEARPASFVMAG